MRLEDAYRVLDLSPSASEEEVKAAHRELTKVWHPDRFAHDAAMQRRAEEKLKLINEAFDAISSSGGGRRTRWSAPPPPQQQQRPQQNSRANLLGCTFTCVFLALYILVRRPTVGGLAIAAVLFGIAAVLLTRLKR